MLEFPTPQEFVNQGAFKILKRWKQDVKRAVGMKRAEKLVQAASHSIGLKEGLSDAKIELKTLLEQNELLSRQLEDIMHQLEQLLEQIPSTKEMLSIPGVSTVTLAGFLAETEDLNGYEHGQQIIRKKESQA
ncbi:hypothetical protein D3C74_255930 [compost metagenome]